MMQRIIVLGMFRSGTSLNTKLVQAWGAYTGPEQDLFGDRYGYLEHLGLQKFNDLLTDGNDRLPPLPGLLSSRVQLPGYRDRAQELLHIMDQQAAQHQAPAWVWKDPRLPMLLPFWADLWGDVIYVVAFRHPASTILSAAQMDGIPEENLPYSAGLAYWQYNMLNILSHTQDSRRKIFVSYDQLVQNPLQECSRLYYFLEEQTGIRSGDSEDRIRHLASLVEAGEHHFRTPRSLAKIKEATREQRALYDFLRVKTICPDESFVSDDFAMYPGWREYLEAVNMLFSMNKSPEDM